MSHTLYDSESYSTDFTTSSEDSVNISGSGQIEMVNRTPIIEPHELQYDERNIIGSGAFGKVYQGKCRGDSVAIKILTTSLRDAEIREFKNECEILMSIRHRNIVTFMGASVEKNNLAMVTELLDGDLEHYLKDHDASFTTLKKLKMMRDIAKGMAWLHGANPPIVHRDLKPSNILLKHNGLEAKITDFGLSVVNEERESIERTAGSALWMAPECHRGESYTEKVDVYSFGIVAWQILRGEFLPFRHYVEQDAFKEFVDAVSLDDERPSLEGIEPRCVHDLLNKLWHPNPEERMDFQEAIHAIDEAILEAMIYDEESRDFWRNEFGDKLEVKYKAFSQALFTTLGIRKPSDKNVRACLRLLFCDNSTSVTLERFGLILQWFGPLRIAGRLDDNLVDRLEEMVQAKYFWGDIPRETAERSLDGKTFLIRLSRRSNPKREIRDAPFVLSFKQKSGSKHFKIDLMNGRYILNGLYVKDKKKVVIESRTLAGIIEKFLKYKRYKDYHPLKGSDYDKLLARNPNDSREPQESYYENSPFTIDGNNADADTMAIFGSYT